MDLRFISNAAVLKNAPLLTLLGLSWLRSTHKGVNQRSEYVTTVLGCTSGGVYVPCIYTHVR